MTALLKQLRSEVNDPEEREALRQFSRMRSWHNLVNIDPNLQSAFVALRTGNKRSLSQEYLRCAIQYILAFKGRKLPCNTDYYLIFPVLPYGMWRLDDGREILFNRAYAPFLERGKDEVAHLIPWRWVTGAGETEYFTSGLTSEREIFACQQAVLRAWAPGLPVE